MNWLARLKKTETAHQMAATNAMKPGFVGFVASIPVHIPKKEALSCAFNDPTPKPDALENLHELEVSESEPAADPNAWRELAQAYHAHHFNCSTCIAAGRGAGYSLRCGVGAALWTSYQNI